MVEMSVKDIAIIGGVAALGIGAYALLKGKNEVTVTPAYDWSKMDDLVKQIQSGNSELLKSMSDILKGSTNGSDDGNDTPGGNAQLPGSSGGGSDSGGSKLTWDDMEVVNDALDLLGMSGQLPKSKLLVRKSVDEDMEKISEGKIGGALLNTPVLKDVTRGTYVIGHALHGTGEFLFNKLTGRDDSGNKK